MSLVAVLIASILGSPHCAGMCGGFVTLYASSPATTRFSHANYSLGRLTTYLSLGIIAGALGSSVNNAGVLLGVQHLAAYLMGVLMIIFGLRLLLIGSGFKRIDSFKSRVGVWLASPLREHLRGGLAAGSQGSIFLLGLVSTLLPCGWLYTFIAVAASTGSPISGALVMGTFWLGTLPVLLSLGFIATKSIGRYREHLPRLTGAILLVAGIFSLAQHLEIVSMGHAHHHHGMVIDQ